MLLGIREISLTNDDRESATRHPQSELAVGEDKLALRRIIAFRRGSERPVRERRGQFGEKRTDARQKCRTNKMFHALILAENALKKQWQNHRGGTLPVGLAELRRGSHTRRWVSRDAL